MLQAADLTIKLNPDAAWSDGVPVTAVFTKSEVKSCWASLNGKP